jgi:CheY-like chemotaxis protein
MSLARPRPLRVLIMGRQDSLSSILMAHLRQRGYEVALLERDAAGRAKGEGGGAGEEGYGDVLLYDMDESDGAAGEGQGGPRAGRPAARFTIVMSSCSVSRDRLDELGAIALLIKPFGVERLQRYLAILQRLLQEEGEPAATATERSDRRRVLIVDDDMDVAHSIQLCLKDLSDYDLAVAYDGLEALERYIEWRPHCIVTDVIMPWMNGYQVIRCLNRSPLPTLPAFVVMSALTRRQLARRPSFKDQAVVYVEKPFFIEHLLAAIEKALQRPAPATGPLA